MAGYNRENPGVLKVLKDGQIFKIIKMCHMHINSLGCSDGKTYRLFLRHWTHVSPNNSRITVAVFFNETISRTHYLLNIERV